MSEGKRGFFSRIFGGRGPEISPAQVSVTEEEKKKGETAEVIRPSPEEPAAVERPVAREMPEVSKTVREAEQLTGDLFGVRIREADTNEKQEHIIKELGILLEIQGTKPTEPPKKLGDKRLATVSSVLRLREGLEAIYKPSRNEAKGWEECAHYPGIEQGGGFKREWLAYMVDRTLELGVVPSTVLRSGDEGLGSMQRWIENPEGKKDPAQKIVTAREAPERQPNPEDLIKLALIDYLTGQMDRHKGNYLIGPDGKLHAIDNGSSFGAGFEYMDIDTGKAGKHEVLAVASELLEQAGGVEPSVQESVLKGLENFLKSPQRQEALKKCFDFALGKLGAENVEKMWQEFMSRIQKVLEAKQLPRHDSEAAFDQIGGAVRGQYLRATREGTPPWKAEAAQAA